MSADPSIQLRPGEKRDRLLGTIMISIGIALVALIPMPFVMDVPSELVSVRHMAAVTIFPFLYGGYILRNSYADNLGESPQFRTPRARRTVAALLFAMGLVAIGGAVIFRS